MKLEFINKQDVINIIMSLVEEKAIEEVGSKNKEYFKGFYSAILLILDEVRGL